MDSYNLCLFILTPARNPSGVQLEPCFIEILKRKLWAIAPQYKDFLVCISKQIHIDKKKYIKVLKLKS